MGIRIFLIRIWLNRIDWSSNVKRQKPIVTPFGESVEGGSSKVEGSSGMIASAVKA